MCAEREQGERCGQAPEWAGLSSFHSCSPASLPGLDFLFLFLVPLWFLSLPSLGLYLILPVAFVVRKIAMEDVILYRGYKMKP